MDPRIRDVLDRLSDLGFDGLGPTDDAQDALIELAERAVDAAKHKDSPTVPIALLAAALAMVFDSRARGKDNWGAARAASSAPDER